jgi:hypothetical protein
MYSIKTRNMTILTTSKVLQANTIQNVYLSTLDVRAVGQEYVDYTSEETQVFINTYRDSIKTEPSEYAYKGYDIGIYFTLLAARYGGIPISRSWPSFQGLGGGFNIVKFAYSQFHNTTYDKVSFPIYSNLKWNAYQSSVWEFSVNAQAGYQFTNMILGYFWDRYSYVVNGGVLLGGDLQFTKSFKKYSPYIKLGYEFNQFNNKQAFGWHDFETATIEDIYYKSHCHLLKIGLGFRI